MVNYELPLAEIVRRLSGRRTCETCRSVFHVISGPPRHEGVCDHCEGRLYQREDDRPESITVRLEAYTRSTAPLIRFYKDFGLLVSIVADGSPEEIFERTIVALESAAVLPERCFSLKFSGFESRLSHKDRMPASDDPGFLLTSGQFGRTMELLQCSKERILLARS